MPKNSNEIENRIQDALHAYHDRDKLKIKALAREFDVPYGRLRERIHDRDSRSTRPSPDRLLDASQV
jgi:hypothetical protein